jgi:hypothetical protein
MLAAQEKALRLHQNLGKELSPRGNQIHISPLSLSDDSRSLRRMPLIFQTSSSKQLSLLRAYQNCQRP